MTPKQEEALYRKWRILVREIDNDVSRIMVRRDMALSELRQERHRGSGFLAWTQHRHFTELARRVRRHVSREKGAGSLYLLLTEISEHPEILSRCRYVGRARASNRRRLNREFDAVVGGQKEHISRKMVLRNRTTLARAVKRVKAYADKRLVSPGQVPDEHDKTPKYTSLARSIRVLRKLTSKYTRLITGHS